MLFVGCLQMNDTGATKNTKINSKRHGACKKERKGNSTEEKTISAKNSFLCTMNVNGKKIQFYLLILPKLGAYIYRLNGRVVYLCCVFIHGIDICFEMKARLIEFPD